MSQSAQYASLLIQNPYEGGNGVEVNLQKKKKSCADLDILLHSYQFFFCKLTPSVLWGWGLGSMTFLYRFKSQKKKFCKLTPFHPMKSRDLDNTSFHYTLYFIQFLPILFFFNLTPPPWVGVGKHDFSVWIWTFYTIASKIFSEN